jgi:MFS family permease
MSKYHNKIIIQEPVRQETKIEAPPWKPGFFQKNFPYIITAVFFLLSFVGIIKHEMWRDEFQAWMVAKDAHSIPELFQNLKYEGNPVLLHAFLYIFTTFTGNPIVMQLFHILISTTVIYLINKNAPFSILQKVLLTFGYFTFYEYNIISRGYGLGLLLIVIFCILYKTRHKHYLLISIILFLLSNSTIFGVMLSGCFMGILILDYFILQKQGKFEKIPFYKLAIPGIIIIVGCTTGLIQILPEHDNTFPIPYPQVLFEPERMQFALSKIITSYFPIPDFTKQHFWNSNIFIKDFHTVNVVIPLLIMAVFIAGFIRYRLITLLYLGGTLLLLFFIYYSTLGHDRYAGHIFVLLVVCMWLISYYEQEKYKGKFFIILSAVGNKIARLLFMLALLNGFIGGIITYAMDLKYPFSASGKAAEFIKKNNLQNIDMVGFTDFLISPIAVQLNKKIYYPERKTFGTFIIWDKNRNPNLKFKEILACFDSLCQTSITKLLLISWTPIITTVNGQSIQFTTGMITNDLQAKFIGEIKPGIVEDEKYYFYAIKKTGK